MAMGDQAVGMLRSGSIPSGGRYLSDVWTLDLDTLAWSQISTTANPPEAVGGGVAEPLNKEEEALLPPAMTPIAGHALTMWGESILCIGGHTKVCQTLFRLLLLSFQANCHADINVSSCSKKHCQPHRHTVDQA